MRWPALAAVAFAAACAHPRVQKADALANVRSVALVQFAVDDHRLLGTAKDPAAREQDASNAWEIFRAELGARFRVPSFVDSVRKPAYREACRAPPQGYFTARGACFLADEDSIESAELSPKVASTLCRALGVDAVAVVYASWGVAGTSGFAPASNTYVMKWFDANGDEVFSGRQLGVSDEKIAIGVQGYDPVVQSDVAAYVKANGEAFGRAMRVFAHDVATSAPAPR